MSFFAKYFSMVVLLQGANQGMQSRALYIGDARSGEIWKSLEWKKIMSGYVKKGTILKIYDSAQPTNHTGISRQISVGAICFSRELSVAAPIIDGISDKQEHVSYSFAMGIVDQRGNIYILDFVKNK